MPLCPLYYRGKDACSRSRTLTVGKHKHSSNPVDELTATYRSMALSLEMEAQGESSPRSLCLMAAVYLFIWQVCACACVRTINPAMQYFPTFCSPLQSTRDLHFKVGNTSGLDAVKPTTIWVEYLQNLDSENLLLFKHSRGKPG